VTCDERLFHRRAAATGNALSPTVDRRVHRTSRIVDEAECSRHRDSVSAGGSGLTVRLVFSLFFIAPVSKEKLGDPT